MIKRPDTKAQRIKRHKRVRAKVSGTPERPRLNVFRSEKNIYAQIIDDVAGNTLVAASSLDKAIEGNGSNKAAARAVGKLIAERARRPRGRPGILREEENTMPRFEREQSEYMEKLVFLNRVSKTVKGGRVAKFSALMVVGDGKGKVGYGLGKAAEVPEAIRKGLEAAKKNMITVTLDGTTIPHETIGEFGAGRVLMKPAAPGTGVIAGGAVRAVVEAAGIKDIRTKCLRSNNPNNVVGAAIEGLKSMRSAEQVAKIRGKSVEEIVG